MYWFFFLANLDQLRASISEDVKSACVDTFQDDIYFQAILVFGFLGKNEISSICVLWICILNIPPYTFNVLAPQNGSLLRRDTDDGTSIYHDRLLGLLRGMGLTFGTVVLVFALSVIVILKRCNHIASNFKHLYGNLFLTDGLYAITVIIHLLMLNAALPLCVLGYVAMKTTLLVYLLTMLVICTDRVISLVKVVPFLIQFRVRSIDGVIIGIWLFALFFQSLASLDSFANYSMCRHVHVVGRYDLLVNIVVFPVLLLSGVVLMIATIVLQRKHLRIMLVAPVSQDRHILGDYVRTALKETPLCASALLLYVPSLFRHMVYFTDYENRTNYHKLPIIAFLPFTVKIMSSIIICATRFPEFRFRVAAAAFPYSKRILRWSQRNLELYYPTISNVADNNRRQRLGRTKTTRVEPIQMTNTQTLGTGKWRVHLFWLRKINWFQKKLLLFIVLTLFLFIIVFDQNVTTVLFLFDNIALCLHHRVGAESKSSLFVFLHRLFCNYLKRGNDKKVYFDVGSVTVFPEQDKSFDI